MWLSDKTDIVMGKDKWQGSAVSSVWFCVNLCRANTKKLRQKARGKAEILINQ